MSKERYNVAIVGATGAGWRGNYLAFRRDEIFH